MADLQERRKYIRFKTPFCVEYKHPDCERVLSGAMKDLSMGGVCVLVDTQDDLPTDKPTLLSLIFPETTLNVKAKIAWQRRSADKNKLGVYFVQLPDSFKNSIYESIFKYCPDEITSKWWNF